MADLDRLERLYLAASELSPEERRRFLEHECANEPELVREVEDLVLNRSQAGEVLRDPAPGDRPGLKVVGPYRIIGVLGRGGMGDVYLAERENPHRRVALKVLQARYSEESRRRFQFEVEVLGTLEHPSICRLYESGIDEATAQPYFAMELVEGRSLLDYCDTRHATARERIDLVANVCDAVQYAHQKGIIHRDLKPNNILITETGAPKVLDFGIARVVGAGPSATAPETKTGMLVGTLRYMSPEQAAGEITSIDVRSDIYTLGVVLFHLLSGRLPYALEEESDLHVQRAICESGAISLRSLRLGFDPDLDAIVSKSLAREPSRRYESAAAFADDLRRFLRDEPITARVPSTWYKVRKFSRRNKGSVSAATMVLVTSVSAAIYSDVQRREADSQRVYAQERLEQADYVSTLFQRFLTAPDPSAGGRHDITLLNAFEHYLPDALVEIERFPEYRPRFESTVARVFLNLNQLEQARSFAESAVHGHEELYGDEDEGTLSARDNLGRVLHRLGEYDEAEDLLRDVLSVRERSPATPPLSVLETKSSLAALLMDRGKLKRAEELYQEVLVGRRELLGDEDPETLSTRVSLALVLYHQGKRRKAASIWEEVYPLQCSTLGEDDPRTLSCQAHLAWALLESGRTDTAARLAEDALSRERRLHGRESEGALKNMDTLAYARGMQGDLDQCVALHEEALEILLKKYSEDHLDVLERRCDIADAQLILGELDSSAASLRDVLKRLRRAVGNDDHRTVRCENLLRYTTGAMGAIEQLESMRPSGMPRPLPPDPTADEALERIPTGWGPELVRTDWWSHKTGLTGVFEPAPGRVRLHDSYCGYVEGVVELPSRGRWEVLMFTNSDDFHVPAEYTRLTINDVMVAEHFNTPQGTVRASHQPFEGSSFAYRFEYWSPTPVYHSHMVTRPGFVRRLDGTVGTVSCETRPNSLGDGARIACTGSASVSADDLTLYALALPKHAFGVFVYGAETARLPLGDATLCVAPPLFRLGPPDRFKRGISAWTKRVDLSRAPTHGGPGTIMAGSTWSFQLIYYDVESPTPGANSSDALTITFEP